MTAATMALQGIAFGAKGFMSDFGAWNEDVARAMASAEGVDLQDCHWAAIRFMRDYYETYELPPSPHTMIKMVGEQLSATRCTTKTLKQLFPNGGCKQACRLAGLPTYYCHAC